jgi:hypothetical protein
MLSLVLAGSVVLQARDNAPPEGFGALFNGKDLAGWAADEETKQHWTVKDGVLEHDGKKRDLWTEPQFGDFMLLLSWRWSGKPTQRDHPVFDADGNEAKGPDGKVKTERVLDGGDSGVFLRGFRKAQANLFCYPCGSGEVWEYRTDPKMPPEVRKACMPKKKADRPVGEWNQMAITMKGDRLTVAVNGEEVISGAELPGVPARGAIGLQHEHGSVQFKNLYVRELK